MTEVWPSDVNRRLLGASTDALRPPRLLLLMPFQDRFDDIAALIHDTALEVFEQFKDFFALPQIDRLDWVTSSGAIQQQIWQKIIEADLIFCDITGYNPNVMFESGVCAAWKEVTQVILIKDRTSTSDSPFDIKPMRYTEYETTYRGLKAFKPKLVALISEAFIRFPDRVASHAFDVPLPYEKDFSDNRDDLSIFTPPFAHRRVVDRCLEFGSLWMFPHSWATIGKQHFHDFALEFSAQFRNRLEDGNSYIGVGLRSQHYYANFAHILYLNSDGKIILTEPDEKPPLFYTDKTLREATPIDITADHRFSIVFTSTVLRVEVDDFNAEFEVAHMKKVLGPGLIRFQASRTWMGLRKLKVVVPGGL
jgi:hypothetical protein